MEQKKKSGNTKRWIAVGLALILFVMNGLSGTIRRNLVKKMSEDSPSGMMSTFFKNMDVSESVVSGTDKKNRILMIPIHGVITSSTSTSIWGIEGYNHEATLQALKSVKDDPTIKGVLLDVNSPGGGVYESAEIHRAITDLKKELKIPVYSLMGSMAASGGYYVSAPADKIFASPETTTGSIGVIMSGFNMSGLLEKLGISSQVIKSAAHKDIGSAYRPMTDDEKAILQDYINSAYDRFLNVVAEGRHMDKEQVRKLADGRIYDGSQAVKNGLVDALGYYDDCVADMAKTIGSEDPEVFTMNPIGLSSLSTFFRSALPWKNENAMVVKYLDRLEGNSAPRAMYLLGGDFYE